MYDRRSAQRERSLRYSESSALKSARKAAEVGSGSKEDEAEVVAALDECEVEMSSFDSSGHVGLFALVAVATV